MKRVIRFLAVVTLCVAGGTYSRAQSVITLIPPPQRHPGQFIGILKLQPLGDGVSMKLLELFGYKSPTEQTLTAQGGFTTDGASIPRALWTAVDSHSQANTFLPQLFTMLTARPISTLGKIPTGCSTTRCWMPARASFTRSCSTGE